MYEVEDRLPTLSILPFVTHVNTYSFLVFTHISVESSLQAVLHSFQSG